MELFHKHLSRRSFLSRIGAISVGAHMVSPTPGKGEISAGAPGPVLQSTESGPWQQVPSILARINPPEFPDRQFNVRDFGADETTRADNRNAIQKAINACAQAGGGRVVVPPGEYIVNGSLNLKSRVNLFLERGAVLRFGVNLQDYLAGPANTKGCVLVRWEGVWCYNYSPLIYTRDAVDIAITGEGTIDGQTDKLWANWYIQKLHQPDRERLYQFGLDQTPLEQRIFGDGHHLAAGTIEFYSCKNILIEGITTRMPLERTVHPVFCENMTIRNVNIQAGVREALNDDGIDPDSCRDVLIEGCTFHNFDDAIALKSGRAKEGWPENGGRPTENVVIRNNIFHGEHNGVSTGSDMAGGVRNVFVSNCQFGIDNSQMYVFNAKSNCDRGGVVEDVYFKDIKVGSCKRLVRLEMEYKKVKYDPVQHPFPPTFRNIHFENVHCKQADETGIDIRGLEVSPVDNVTLKRIYIEQAKSAFQLEHIKRIKFNDVEI